MSVLQQIEECIEWWVKARVYESMLDHQGNLSVRDFLIRWARKLYYHGTPVKNLVPGDRVIVRGFEDQGSRVIDHLYGEMIPGGVRLVTPINADGLDFHSWNEDVLTEVG